jgi:hypothetical protein
MNDSCLTRRSTPKLHKRGHMYTIFFRDTTDQRLRVFTGESLDQIVEMLLAFLGDSYKPTILDQISKTITPNNIAIVTC